MGFFTSIVILCVASTAFGARGAYGDGLSLFNVLNYGAKGDGKSDDSQAFLKTWEAACKSDKTGQTPTLVVPPRKSFLVRPLHFQGPCKSAAIKFQINDLMVTGSGSGVIDGRGHVWWSRVKSHLLPHDKSKDKCKRPKALTFLKMENLQLSGLTHLDSPRAHIRLQNCTFAKLSSLLIQAPEDSPNTDGIAIADSSHIRIRDSTIGTGDDCISIKGGSSIIDVAGVKCGPGHGISVGSLGYKGAYDTVEGVNVRNCVFKSSDNGARIKTWEGGSGYVRNIHFENILVSKARNPIIIDQNYSDDQNRDSKVRPPAVKVSNVTYRNVKGISRNEPSIKLRCAGGTPCTDIVMHRIKLDSLEPGKRSYADCENVVNATFSFVDPPISCHTS